MDVVTIIGLRLDRFLRQALCFMAFMALIGGAGAAASLALFMTFVAFGMVHSVLL